MPSSLKTFIIYARDDREYKNQLLRHLKPLVKNGYLNIWHDGDILPGEDWEKLIKSNLKSSQLVLVLVSVNCLNSEFIEGQELKTAIMQLREGHTRIVPIIISPCGWRYHQLFDGLQGLPQDMKPVSEWPNIDRAWTNVVESIAATVEDMRDEEYESVEQNRQEEKPNRHIFFRYSLGFAGMFLMLFLLFQFNPFFKSGEVGSPELFNTIKDSASIASLQDKMVFIQGGKFKMGSTDADADDTDEDPIHEVTLSSFYLGKYEVTMAEFQTFVSSMRYKTVAENVGTGKLYSDSVGDFIDSSGINWRFDDHGKPRPLNEYNNYPVTQVSWDDATEYCKWLSKLTGNHYRLPTEAEWEYAAGGGNASKTIRTKWPGTSNEDSLRHFGNYFEVGKDKDGYEYTSPIGKFRPNSLGLYDMAGNVWEWCNDLKGKYNEYHEENPPGPKVGSSNEMVMRGGSWKQIPKRCRTAARGNQDKEFRRSNIGFRLAMSLKQDEIKMK